MFKRLLLLALMAILILAFASAHGQQLPSAKAPAARACSHDGYELWQELKILPVQFIGFNDEGAIWKYQDNDITHLGAFVLNEKTQYVAQEKKHVSAVYVQGRPDAVWLCYYCARCHTLLIAYELKPGSSPIN
jgi:hypothetical protein